MRAIRTVLSALAILAGALLIITWLLSFLLVRTVEDGSAARAAASAALNSPAVMSRVVDQLDARTSQSLSNAGVDLDGLGLAGPVREVMERVSTSEDFERLVLDTVDAASIQLHHELSDSNRPYGPFAVRIDASDHVNHELGALPVVGESVPRVELAPVSVEVLSADSFEKARSGYERLEFAAQWFLWLGLACLAIGLVVSTRKRYVVGKFLLALGAMALLAGVIMVFATPERLVEWAPGGHDSPWAEVVANAAGSSRLPRLRAPLLVGGTIAVVLGAATSAWARATDRRD